MNFELTAQNSQNSYFNEFLSWQVYHVWAKKVQRSYVSWHWRVMQNLNKNWIVVWSRILNFIGLFYLKGKLLEPKKMDCSLDVHIVTLKSHEKFGQNWIVVSNQPPHSSPPSTTPQKMMNFFPVCKKGQIFKLF